MCFCAVCVYVNGSEQRAEQRVSNAFPDLNNVLLILRAVCTVSCGLFSLLPSYKFSDHVKKITQQSLVKNVNNEVDRSYKIIFHVEMKFCCKFLVRPEFSGARLF